MIGLSCLPEMRAIAFDPTLTHGSNNCARIVLAELRDADSIPRLREVALRPPTAGWKEEPGAAVHCIGQIGGEAARNALFDIGEGILKAGRDLLIVGAVLDELSPWPDEIPPPTAEQVAFLEALDHYPALNHYPAMVLKWLRDYKKIP
jgi:hypothetical protein